MRPGIFVLLLAVACSTGSSPGSSAGNTLDHPSARHARDLITAEELAGLRARNVYDAVAQLRPSFLQPHRSASPSGQPVHAMVYIDDTPLADGLDALRHMRPDDVVEIRFLSGPDATQRFGTGNPAGAILVKTKH